MKKMYCSSAILVILFVVSSMSLSIAAPPNSVATHQAGCADCSSLGNESQKLLPIQREIMRMLRERHAAAAGARSMRPNFCFAPGTPESYIRSVTEQTGGIGKHFRVDEEPGHWEVTATDGSNIPRGDAITLTWSIVPDGTHIPQFSPGNGAAANSSLRARLNTLYGNEATWMALFQQVFDRWAELTGITYVHESNDDMAAFTSNTVNGESVTPGILGTRADIRIGGRPIDGNSNTLAFNFGAPVGDMVIDTADNSFEDMAGNSLLFRNTVSHEHGHGLGINHVCPINDTKIMEPAVSEAFDGPQHDDILAGQRQHGDPMENNDTFAQATNLGVLSDGAITANTVLNGAFLSIDGSDDVDIFKFNVAAAGKTASLTLRPIGQSYLEGPQNPDGSCTAGTLFDSLSVKNLGIELISSDASTVLASADVNGVGQTEMIATVPLPGGTGPFFVRVFGGAVDSVQLYEFDLTVATGSSGALDHFAFDAIASPRGVNQAFSVGLSAEDIFNGPAAGFTGTVDLSVLARESILITEIDPGTTDRVEFNNVSERTVDISGWQVVVYDATSGATPASTTTLPAFSSIAPDGVFTLTEDGSAPGILPNLSSGSGIDWAHNSSAITVLLLDAAGNLVDFATLGDSSVFSNPLAISADEWSGPGISDSASDTYQRTGSSDTSTAADWSAAAQTFGSKNVGLTSPFPARAIAFTPTTTGAFGSGMRMESLTFSEPGNEVVLKADDGAGHIGYSNPFNLELVDDISVALTAVPGSVRAGETITYTATVQNAGPSGATSVTLTDMLPANTAFVSASSSQGSVGHDAGSPGTVTANLGALAGGASATVTINLTSSATGTLMNTVSVGRGEADSFAPNNTASTAVSVVDGPDNVEEFNAFSEMSGSFPPNVNNDVGNQFEYIAFTAATTAGGFQVDTAMSQNGRGLTFSSGEDSGIRHNSDISPGDYTTASHMISFWFKFSAATADGTDNLGQLIQVYNQGASGANDFAYVLRVGVDMTGQHGMQLTISSFDTASPQLADFNLDFIPVTPSEWHRCVIHYTSASDTTATDGAFQLWIDPANGAAAPQMSFPDGRFEIASTHGAGPLGRYGFGRSVGFAIDANGPDMFIDSIGSWDGVGMAGVNDVQAGVDFLNSSIPNLAIAAVSAAKAEGNSGNTAFEFTVTRTGPNNVATTVNFAVAGTGANAANAADFGGSLPSGSVMFTAGETSKAVTINVSGDATVEPDEEFMVTISVPSGGAVINVPAAIGTIQNDDQDFDFGDAPDPAYPTLLASDGARHGLSGPFLGASRDVDADGQSDTNATGDDLDGGDDDDGVIFTTSLRAGANANVTVNASGSGGRLSAWIDFDGDGSWADPGEQIITDTALSAGDNQLSFSVPAGAATGDTFARFRLSTQTGLTFSGLAPDGEVEDYKVAIVMNAVPVANAGGDLMPVVGQTVTLMGMGTDADMSDTLSFAWDFDYDGMTFNVDAATQNAMTAYASPGARVVALRVTDNLGASHIDTTTVTVGKAATSTAILSDNPDHSAVGQSVTIVAQVTVTAPGSGTPTGMVEFFEGANSLGQSAVSGGMASLATTQLPGGMLSLTAQYLGDANFAGSVSSPEAHRVNQPPSATVSAPSTSVVGETITLTGMGTDPDVGDILSFEWDFDFDGVTFVANVATQNAMTAYASPGARTIALRVTDNLGASQIDTISVAVGKANTVSALTSSPNPSDLGAQVMLTATIAVSAPGAGTPTGNVVFKEGSNTLGVGTLNASSVATLNTTQLPVGALSLTAEYQGDVNFNTSISASHAHTVEALLDFGDAPDPLASTAGQYPTRLASDGARHRIIDGAPRLGAEIDAEIDGQPDANASADDGAGALDDENGVTIPTLVLGTTVSIQVEVTVAAGKLDAWIDFNQNGVWESPGEQIAVDLAVGVGMQILMVPVDQSALTGGTFARFRLSSQGGLAPTGEASDGEVEDHRLIVIAAEPPTANHISEPKPDASGDIDVVFSGTPGKLYRVQASSDLKMWTTIDTVRADANGVVFLKELGTGSMPGRFYRVFELDDE